MGQALLYSSLKFDQQKDYFEFSEISFEILVTKYLSSRLTCLNQSSWVDILREHELKLTMPAKLASNLNPRIYVELRGCFKYILYLSVISFKMCFVYLFHKIRISFV